MTIAASARAEETPASEFGAADRGEISPPAVAGAATESSPVIAASPSLHLGIVHASAAVSASPPLQPQQRQHLQENQNTESLDSAWAAVRTAVTAVPPALNTTLDQSLQQDLDSEQCVDASAPLHVDSVPGTVRISALPLRQQSEPQGTGDASTPRLPLRPAVSHDGGAETPHLGPRHLTWDTPSGVRQLGAAPGATPTPLSRAEQHSILHSHPRQMLPLLSPAPHAITCAVTETPAWDASPSPERGRSAAASPSLAAALPAGPPPPAAIARLHLQVSAGQCTDQGPAAPLALHFKICIVSMCECAISNHWERWPHGLPAGAPIARVACASCGGVRA